MHKEHKIRSVDFSTTHTTLDMSSTLDLLETPKFLQVVLHNVSGKAVLRTPPKFPAMQPRPSFSLSYRRNQRPTLEPTFSHSEQLIGSYVRYLT